jgi:hypothetical protein
VNSVILVAVVLLLLLVHKLLGLAYQDQGQHIVDGHHIKDCVA